jgi:tRNA pseudouridine32 synthase / 23S rRNA pseudouridine746 synthase
VFENAALVAADKPGGVLTVPGRMGSADPRPVLGRELERRLGCRLWPVHRLDLEVTGLVVFARTAEAHRIAGAAFESRRVRKHYRALTEGAGALAALPASFTWDSLLVRGKKRSFEAPHGKQAITQAQAVRRVPAAGWLAADEGGAPPVSELIEWALEPETGRAHQLRVHLSQAGFPVVGDALYGARTRFATPSAIALRSVRLELTDAGERAALGLAGPLEVAGF